MASDKEYLDYILDQLSLLDDISYKPMMGEYLLYYRGKLFGGIYDNRLLLKPTSSALAMMPQAVKQSPYPGAKDMLLAEEPDDREFLAALVQNVCAELPGKKK